MPISAAGKNLMLDALGASAVYVSLHTADPGATGVNEVTGGAPAYARKAITWSGASSGSKSASNQPVFDVPACSISYVGYWSAITGGTFYGSSTITTEVYAAAGQYTLTSDTLSLT